MELPLFGGCLCGKIRYEISAEPVMAGHCHCRDCQRATGAPHFSALSVPTPALRLEGGPKLYARKADSGNEVSRGFCPDCGTTLFGRSEGMPQTVQIAAATLDDPSVFKPQMNLYLDSAQPWDRYGPELPGYPKLPQG